MKYLLLVGCLCWGVTERIEAQDSTNLAPRALTVLSNACQYLAAVPAFSLRAEIWREHVNEAGEKLQFSRVVEMEVKRPDRMHLEINSPHAQRGFWYEGRTLTILDRVQNLYSSAPMPPTLDEALDTARDQFGVDLPLVDLAVSNPYTNALARVQSARYFGLASTLGYNCHHLAFTQDNVDWQVWIEDGPHPVIRKFVITHKQEPGAPEFTALLQTWTLADRIADSDFVFEPPRGALPIAMRKQEAPAAPGLPPAAPSPSASTNQ